MLFFNKKAFAQVDWAISLGIFLLFLVWFFMFIAPNFSKTTSSDALEYIVESKLDQFSWNIYKIPIFVKLDKVYDFNNLIPLFAKLDLGNYSYRFDSGLLETYGDQVVFLANLTKKLNIFWVLKNADSDFVSDFYDLTATFSSVNILSKNFKAYFDKGVFSSADYFGNLKILSSIVNVDNFELNNGFDFSKNRLFADYNYTSDSFSYSQVVFANNPGIYFYFDYLGSKGNKFNYTHDFVLYKYHNYFIDNANYGSFGLFDNQSCFNYTSDYINFYDNLNGLVFVFSKPVNISFCVLSDTLSLRFSSLLDDNFNYKLMFYQGSYEQGELFKVKQKAKVGVSEVLSGIDLDKLKKYDFDKKTIKRRWGFPENKDFRIVIYDLNNNETFFDFKTALTDTTSNVYAKEFNDYILYPNGSMKRVMLSIMTW